MCCNHIEIVDREGIICCKCGLVLDQNYVYVSTKTESGVDTELNEICARLHTPYYSQIKACYEKLSDQHPKLSCKYLRALALYNTLNKLESSQDLHYLCFLCGVDSNQFWKVSKQVQGMDDTFNYSFAESFLASLHLPFRIVQEIKTRAKTVPGSFSPKTKIAAFAYVYLRTTPQKMTMKTLIKQLGVSQMSCYRCFKSIRHAGISPW